MVEVGQQFRFFTNPLIRLKWSEYVYLHCLALHVAVDRQRKELLYNNDNK